MSGSDGGSASEKAYRQLLTATLEPLARIIESEFAEKIRHFRVSLDFRRLGRS